MRILLTGIQNEPLEGVTIALDRLSGHFRPPLHANLWDISASVQICLWPQNYGMDTHFPSILDPLACLNKEGESRIDGSTLLLRTRERLGAVPRVGGLALRCSSLEKRMRPPKLILRMRYCSARANLFFCHTPRCS